MATKKTTSQPRVPWVGFDLDGTLASFHGWKGHTHIGPPIPNIVRELQNWLSRGHMVKIFTARVAAANAELYSLKEAKQAIERWCLDHIGTVLPVTAEKDFDLKIFYDDRAVALVENTGMGLTDLLQRQVGDWAEETFQSSDEIRMRKLREELDELAENPSDALEMADILLVLLHHAHVHKTDLFTATMHKFEVCQNREWQEPDEHGVTKHVKE